MTCCNFFGRAGHRNDERLLRSLAGSNNAFDVAQILVERDWTVSECIEAGVCVWRTLVFGGAGTGVEEAMLIDRVVVRKRI